MPFHADVDLLIARKHPWSKKRSVLFIIQVSLKNVFWTFIRVIQICWIYSLKNNCLLVLRVYILTVKIRQAISATGLILVGWYHSHPFSQASPSVKDIDCQMSYQLCMKGSGSNYFPCVGVIIGEQCLQNMYKIIMYC